jgi:hypothetical protein
MAGPAAEERALERWAEAEREEVDWVVVARSVLVGLADWMEAWKESDSRICTLHIHPEGWAVDAAMRMAVGTLGWARAVVETVENLEEAGAAGALWVAAVGPVAAVEVAVRICRTSAICDLGVQIESTRRHRCVGP